MKKLTSPFQLIKKSVDLFSKKENLIFLAKVYLPMAVFPILYIVFAYLPFFTKNLNSSWFVTLGLVVNAVNSIVGVFFMAAGIIAIAKVIEGKTILIEKVYKEAWKKYWMFLLLSAVLLTFYMLGFVLLVVPGVLLVVWLVFSRFIMIEKGMGIKASIMESKSLTKGYYWKILYRLIVFGITMFLSEAILSLIPYGVGSVALTFCGGLFLLPIYLLYKEISAQ